MLKSILIAGLAGFLLLSGPAESAKAVGDPRIGLEPALSGSVSANGLFPIQAMEEEFALYLHWVEDLGISRLTAFESLIDAETSANPALPTQRMQEQFVAYMRWVEDQGLSPFYAFTVTTDN